MIPLLDDLFAVFDGSSSPEMQVRITNALKSPQSELSRAVNGVERWVRDELNPFAPSADAEVIPHMSESNTLKIKFEQRAAALLGKGTAGRGHAELARLLLDEIGVASPGADYSRVLEALDDPSSELSQLVRGFKQWVEHSLKRP